MSDGGSKDNFKEFQEHKRARIPTGNDDFVRSSFRIAVAQVCKTEGFHGFQKSAIEGLTDVAIGYAKEIGKTAKLAANLAGRSECNALDVIQGLEDLGSIQGFPGASDVHHLLGNSGIIEEIRQYLRLLGEIPFVYSLSRFPVVRERKLPRSFCQRGEEPPGEHVPAWLPAFPSPQNQVNLPACNGGGETGSGEGHGKKPREEELPSLNEQHRLTTNGPSKEGLSHDHGDPFKTKKTAGINPFLAPSLLYGEKEVSSIYHPSVFPDAVGVANHVSVIEPFPVTTEVPQRNSSGIEGEQNNENINNNNNNNNNFRLGKRPVQFNLCRVKKPLPTSRNVIAQDDEDENLDVITQDDKHEKMDEIAQDNEAQKVDVITRDNEHEKLDGIAQDNQDEKLDMIAQDNENEKPDVIAQINKDEKLDEIAWDNKNQKQDEIAWDNKNQKLDEIVQDNKGEKLDEIAQDNKAGKLDEIAQDNEDRKLDEIVQDSKAEKLDEIAQDNDDGKHVNCIGMHAVKDERQQRAEQISKESLENPSSPPQL